jgi:hypothetical protein
VALAITPDQPPQPPRLLPVNLSLRFRPTLATNTTCTPRHVILLT